MPLQGKTLQYVPPNASTQQQIATLNRLIDIINNFQQQLIFADSTVKRMFIGYQKDGWGPGKDFGMKVSVPGVDVMTAKDDQLLFKMDGATWYWYDPTTKKNFTQIGILPDATGGIAVAAPGSNVADAITS